MQPIKTKQKNKNIPKLRFPGFSREWGEKELRDCLNYEQPTPYIVMSTEYDNSYKTPVLTAGKSFILGYTNEVDGIFKENLPVIIFDDFTTTSQFVDFPFKVKSSAMKILKSKNNANIKFIYEVMKMINYETGGHGRQWISKYSNIKILVPQKEEQEKIARFLGAVDEWIDNLKAQEEKLEEYKKGMMQKIFSQEIRFKPARRSLGEGGDENGKNFPDWEEKKLGEICQIKTGKLDANAMENDGKYRFYTCAKEVYKINNYAFDTEALLVSGNGANVGYIHYYKGKFNAYQRTYVLDNFSDDIIFIKYLLEKNLKSRINKEKKEGNTPYIVLGTLADMGISLPSHKEQKRIADFLSSLDNLIELKQQQITQAQSWKKGLMQGLFV